LSRIIAGQHILSGLDEENERLEREIAAMEGRPYRDDVDATYPESPDEPAQRSHPFSKAVLKPPNSKRWLAGPAATNIANHLGLRRQSIMTTALSPGTNGCAMIHASLKAGRAALAPEVQDASG